MAASSSNRHLRPHLVDQQLSPTDGKGVEQETRDWAELPVDALLAVLRRLDVVDILMGPGHVCRPWRRATREEPDLWRNIDIRHVSKNLAYGEVRVDLAASVAVRRSSGRCEAFWAQDLRVDLDEPFLLLAESTPQLKSLRLISCKRTDFRKDRLSLEIRKFHMLEELELSLYSASQISSCFLSLAGTCRAAAEACPLLKRLRLNKNRFHGQSRIGDTEAMEIGKMRSLQVLQLFGNSLGNDGLMTILRGCVRLESLDIRHCFNVEMNDGVRAACGRLHTLRLPDDSVDDYDLSFGSPAMERGSGAPLTFRYVEGLEDPDPCGNPGSDWYWR